MKELTCDIKVSDRADTDSTVLFDPARLAPEIVHAAETPESLDLPAATDVEEHLTSLSHSILETSLGRKFQYSDSHPSRIFSFGITCRHFVVCELILRSTSYCFIVFSGKTPSFGRTSSRLSTHSMFGRQISDEDDEEVKKERFFNDTLVNLDLLGHGPTTKSQKSSSHDSDDELLDLLQDLVFIV